MCNIKRITFRSTKNVGRGKHQPYKNAHHWTTRRWTNQSTTSQQKQKNKLQKTCLAVCVARLGLKWRAGSTTLWLPSIESEEPAICPRTVRERDRDFSGQKSIFIFWRRCFKKILQWDLREWATHVLTMGFRRSLSLSLLNAFGGI